LIMASFLRWTQTTLASQGRLVFPAISVIAVLFGLGICSLVPRRWTPHLVAGLALSMLAAAIAAPFLAIFPSYPKVNLIAEADAVDFQRPLNISFEDKVNLKGIDVSPARINPGENLTVSLHYSAISAMDRDYSVFIHIFDSTGAKVGQVDSYPGRGALRTSRWQPGYALKDTYSIPIAGSIETPSVLRVEIGIYDYDNMKPLTAEDPSGKPLGSSPTVAYLKAPGKSSAAQEDQGLHATLGDEIGLVTYQIERNVVSPGGTIVGHLSWRALKKPIKDYSVFVQIVGRNGLVAQYDSYPRRGTYPTSFWDAGEVVEDQFQINLDASVPAGEYDLITGMYDLATGRRLPTGAEMFIMIAKIQVAKN
jgi:hypothetical protein